MRQETQPRPQDSKGLEMLCLLVGVLIAWPAILLGALARWQIKARIDEPFPYWIGAGVLGSLGAFVLLTRANPTPLLLAALSDLGPLALHLGLPTAKHVLLDLVPLWARSVLVFPWVALILELFGPRNLQATLLAQERHRRLRQARQSTHAARRATHAPDQINGQAILGALIDNPNRK